MKNLGKLYILGDSYSTFEHETPNGNAVWYYLNETNNRTDVTEFSQTWWYKLLNNTENELIKNNSFSGATVCNTGYGGAYCPQTSFIGRFEKDIANNVFKNAPDTFLLFGGTNDSWAGSPIGNLQFDGFTDDDIKKALPAFCFLVIKIKKEFPDTRLCVILNTDIKPEITNGYIEVCKKYGIEYLQLQNIEKQCGHPDKKGMEQIYTQILNFL